jgi:site-specific DNA-methyltransferase (adenine-specific)
MAGLEPESFDAVVCDPPYDLTSGKKGGTGEASLNLDSPYGRSRIGTGGFMGAAWDATGVAFDPETWRAVMRVMKPGAYLLSFGGSRTYHRMACAIEDAGFEVTDSIDWIYAGGFAKSLNIGKQIDKGAGAEREVIAEGQPVRRMIPGATQNRTGSWVKDDGRQPEPRETAPSTEEAAEWEGWGTALRPSHETIVVARKPFRGTYAANVLAHGTGALNIDGCRVGADGGAQRAAEHITGHQENNAIYGKGLDLPNAAPRIPGLGRWPPNVLLTHSAECVPAGTRVVRGDNRRRESLGQREAGFLDIGAAPGDPVPNGPLYGDAEAEIWDCAEGCPVAELDRQSGVLTSGANPDRRRSDKFRDTYGEFRGQGECVPARGADSGGASRFFPVFRYTAKADASERPRLPDGTAHPTVKPRELMIWLVKLVSRRGGLILDPFAGSGTTGEACLIEGRRCVLIEREPKFAELIKVRLSKPMAPTMFDVEAM